MAGRPNSTGVQGEEWKVFRLLLHACASWTGLLYCRSDKHGFRLRIGLFGSGALAVRRSGRGVARAARAVKGVVVATCELCPGTCIGGARKDSERGALTWRDRSARARMQRENSSNAQNKRLIPRMVHSRVILRGAGAAWQRGSVARATAGCALWLCLSRRSHRPRGSK
jgi:hypothetical protein